MLVTDGSGLAVKRNWLGFDVPFLADVAEREHRSVRAPSKIPQFTESRTVPLLTLVMVKWPWPALVNFHCWHGWGHQAGTG